MPAISIIMPVFNAAKFVRESIDSLLCQEFKDFEIIVIDDYSSDNSVDTVRSMMMTDHRLQLMSNEGKKGLVGALNTGLQRASGKYIARADADDICRPRRLELQLHFLEHNPHIWLVGGAYEIFGEGIPRRAKFHPTGSVELAWRFLSNTYFCHPTVMFRREVYDNLGGYPEHVAEDFAYFSKVVQRYPCANLNRVLIDYREHATKYSNVYSKSIADSVRQTYQHNFFYYTGTLKHAEEFYQFHRSYKVLPNTFPRIVVSSFTILNKIRKDYGLDVTDRKLISFSAKILGEFLLSNCRRFIRYFGSKDEMR